MNNILEVDKLNKTLGTFQLCDITFHVPQGCITGLIGVDGSGKSSIIKCLISLIRRDSGKAEYWGTDIDEAEQEIKKRLGVVLENNTFYDGLSIRETKDIISAAYPNWQEPVFQKNWSSWSDKGYALNQKLSSLSKKEKLVLSIAIALAHDAELLILDEPFCDIDPVGCSEILDILKEFVKIDNHGILISSHDGMDIHPVVDDLILIDKGRVVFQEDKDLLLEKHRRIKGALSMLGQIPNDEFIRIDKGNFGFTGICMDYNSIKPYCANLTVERSTIVEIMMAYLWRRRNA